MLSHLHFHLQEERELSSNWDNKSHLQRQAVTEKMKELSWMFSTLLTWSVAESVQELWQLIVSCFEAACLIWKNRNLMLLWLKMGHGSVLTTQKKNYGACVRAWWTSTFLGSVLSESLSRPLVVLNAEDKLTRRVLGSFIWRSLPL